MVDIVKKIREIKDLILYLKREQEPFITYAVLKTYGSLLKKATGFEFKYRLYTIKNKLSKYYYSKKELIEADLHYAKLIKENPELISKLLIEEQSLLNFDFNKATNKEKIIQFNKIFLYNTVIPYRLLSAIEKNNLRTPFRKKLEQIRETSYYQVIFDKEIKPLYKEAAKILAINYDEALFLSQEELLVVLNKKINKNIVLELKLRTKGYYFLEDDKDILFYYEPIENLEENNYSKKLQGKIAYKGYAKGEVKIINTPKDINKLVEGDILVSINTNPSIIQAIKKASAIVTDEGGITCHAAIVSRELKIPCIIGTKNATEILNDGDLIEVDANKGIVKIINS